MAVTQFIAHRVLRPIPSEPCQLQYRERVFPLTGKVEEVFRELKQAYLKRLGKHYGRFSEDVGRYPLASWISQYQEEKISFHSLSEHLLKQLKCVLDNTELAVEGHVFVALETLEIGSSLYIFWVHQNQAAALDGELNFNDSLVLDTSNVAWAARVNLDEWNASVSQHYLGVISWRGDKDMSDALLEIIGFTDKVDTKADTETFLEAVDSYVTQFPEEEKPALRGKVVEYCLEQDKRGTAVELDELSRFVNENAADDFREHIEKHSPAIKKKFIADRGQVKNYVRISGRDELISMSFASGCLGETIVYDPESDSLTIRKIPSALKSRLMKHLREGS